MYVSNFLNRLQLHDDITITYKISKVIMIYRMTFILYGDMLLSFVWYALYLKLQFKGILIDLLQKPTT